jgi:hypothetical protein
VVNGIKELRVKNKCSPRVIGFWAGRQGAIAAFAEGGKRRSQIAGMVRWQGAEKGKMATDEHRWTQIRQKQRVQMRRCPGGEARAQLQGILDQARW